MSKRHKKKKRRNSNHKNIKTKIMEVESPLSMEVTYITNKVHEEEGKLYELESKKRNITEKLVDKILLNNDLRHLINDYCNISKELESTKTAQENRLKDLESKQSKLTEENKTIIKKITEYENIETANYKVGLYNRECKCPVAICKQKNVYLSFNDVKFKKCLQHNHKICKHLQWLDTNELY